MPEKKTRFIVVTGSIMSGLGKGIFDFFYREAPARRGYNVVPIKFDGYLNVDCGTMNPFRHGEVFVLDDGTEVDMDFGTYERFLEQIPVRRSSITGGQAVPEDNREGDGRGNSSAGTSSSYRT